MALAVASVIIVVDRVTKAWAENNLVAGPCRPGGDECIDILLSLRLHLVYNYGAAFSTGIGFGPVFGVLAAIMSVVLFVMAARSGHRTRAVLFGLIAGGAIGNLIDRVVRAEDGLLSGGVIDFIDLQWWPVFNVADMAVVTGVLAFVVHSLLYPEDGVDRVPEDAVSDDVVSDDAVPEDGVLEDGAVADGSSGPDGVVDSDGSDRPGAGATATHDSPAERSG